MELPRIENRSWNGSVMDVWAAAEGSVRFVLGEKPAVWVEVVHRDGGVDVRCDGGEMTIAPEAGNKIHVRVTLRGR